MFLDSGVPRVRYSRACTWINYRTTELSSLRCMSSSPTILWATSFRVRHHRRGLLVTGGGISVIIDAVVVDRCGCVGAMCRLR